MGRNGERLSAYFWERRDQLRQGPLCVLVHGMAEHAGRYRHIVEKLADTQWSYAALDLRGHGHSDGPRMRMSSIWEMCEDVHALIEYVQARSPRPRPLVLFGHSFGGLISIFYATAYPQRLSGLVLSSPVLGLYPLFPFTDKIIKGLYFLFPHIIIPKPVQPEKLTHDLDKQREYRDDPFVYKFMGIDLLYHMLKGGEHIRQNVRHLGVPLLMILAGRDEIVDNDKSLSFFDRLTDVNKECYVCEGLYHETFNEIRSDEPIGVLKRFLKRMESCL